MSDEKDESLDQGETEKMTDRLASLRASIRASKDRTGTPPIGSLRAPIIPDDVEVDPTLTADDDFVADDTVISQSAEFPIAAPPPEPDEPEPDDAPPPRAKRRTGEQFSTNDLHRVIPPEEPVLESSSGLLSQMDQASEAAELAAEDAPAADSDAYTVEPTVVHRLEDLTLIQGTPLYMSPEQCRSDAVEPPTDVYSLGVMMFELEGHPPFLADSLEEVVYKHLDAPIPEQTSEFTPDEVRDLVHRMLAKDAADRPGMVEIIQVLQRHTSIGGADVQGLEEESWTVSEIEESQPIVVASLPETTMEVEPFPERKLPIWLFAIFGLVALMIVVLIANSGGDEEPVAEPTQTTGPADPVVVQQTTAPEVPEVPDETVAMEFGDAKPDAGTTTPDAGAAATEVAEQQPEEVVEVEEKPEPKPKPKTKPRKRTPRKKKKKTPTLQEIRL